MVFVILLLLKGDVGADGGDAVASCIVFGPLKARGESMSRILQIC